MTVAPLNPAVELRFNPTDLSPLDLPRIGAYLGTPAEALEAALAIARVAVRDQMRAEIQGLADPTHAQVLRMADLAWQAVAWKYRKVSAPIIADAYIHAYRAAEAGDVPMSVIYSLAEKHAEKIGDYFHTSSADALSEGFSSLVNRRVPAKEAADLVMDAYGLSPRQMRAYTGASAFRTPISDVMPRPLKARARAYIEKSFTSRIRKLSAQEEHNISEQAKQFAWMWLQDKGRLTDKAQKMWITAHDEKVCAVCGPLNGRKVKLNQQFVTKEGAFWTPGLHPNCRCVVRLIENRFAKDLYGAELGAFNREHPRGEAGRFSAKARTKTIDVDEEFERIISGIPPNRPRTHITYGEPSQPSSSAQRTLPDTKIREEFAALIAAQPQQPRGLTSQFASPFTGTREKLEFTPKVDTEAIVEAATQLSLDLRAMTVTKPQVKTKTPTVPLDSPAYAHVTVEQLENGDITKGLRLHHKGSIRFHTDVSVASLDATLAKLNARTDAIRDAKGHTTIRRQDNNGNWYRAKVSESAVKAVATWNAHTATQKWHPDYDPDATEPQWLPLNWKAESPGSGKGRGKGLPPSMPYSQVSQELNMSPEPFQHFVVRVDRVHGEEGSVEDLGPGSYSPTRSYTFEGEYDMVPDSVEESGTSDIPMTIYRLEPRGSVELPEDE